MLTRFWYTKLQALMSIHNFDSLEVFTKLWQSPIRYEVFVKHLVDKGHQKEALLYVLCCDGPKCANLYVLCNDWHTVVKECKDHNDKAKLECVISCSFVFQAACVLIGTR